MWGALLGLPPGVFLLVHINERIVTALLGVLLIAFSLYNLVHFQMPNMQQRALAFPFGFAAGLLGGAYNTSGPPLVIYGVLRRWTPEEFPGTLQSVFVSNSVFVLVAHSLTGLWTPTVLHLYTAVLPFIPAAVLVGWRFNRIIPRKQFERLVYLVLILMGLVLLFA
ncbi:MAG: sulfite exporter TauE/SafE family protein [Chloroflexaceae bacterium]|nr:sulfite exporter TauE/SafE family protein [Chloroflexaceae bacterium]